MTLAESVWADPDVQAAVRDISVHVATIDLPAPNASPPALKCDWFHLLRCASIFLDTDDEYYHDIGLRILHSSLTFDVGADKRALAAALLAKISSNPSLRVAISRSLVPNDVLDQLPLDLALEVAARQIASTINIGTPREFVGNNFQGTLWRALEQYDWVSASAPTSAGKSFVLEKWIEHAVRTLPRSTTFFIVPTRALISQVETDLRTMLGSDRSDINITSLPLAFDEPRPHNIYIYTQERFHLYLLKQSYVDNADLIIIDEAQQIGASRRGVLLQQVLELASQRYPDAKVLFASPSTKNPQSLLQFAPEGKRTHTISGTKPTVNQNLIWVEQVPRKPTDWKLSLMSDGKALPMGSLFLPNRPSITQKLPFIAYQIGAQSGGNVIYVNRAADAEKVAEILCQFVTGDSSDPELLALSELCEKAVHRRFKLRRFVTKGVAFHCGNIPQLIRTEVERLFSSGKIKFLVCTSTLIEGVNLSCRNIFMRNPKRGNRNLMNIDDFWNLAGRAGRWGKEFQGNIYCIDPLKAAEWLDGSAPRSKQKHTIQIATQRLANEFAEFVNYAADRARLLDTTNRFHEYLLSYLLFRRSEFGSLETSVSIKSLSSGQATEITALVDETIESLKVPVAIVLRNPGINPWGMNALYEYFVGKSDDELEGLVPADPLSDAPIRDEKQDESKDAAVENFVAIFSRITKYLEGPLGIGNAAYGNAILVVHWMRGYPLHRIIDGQIRYWSKRDPKKGDTAVIRETMEQVEKIARFETPKYLHAYLDVLRVLLNKKGRHDLFAESEDFWLYLEFGVSKRTHLSLISLGLSRSSVTALSDYITEDSLSENGCLDWLVDNSWTEFGLPRLVELEITTVLNRHRKQTPIANSQESEDE
jgi:hypothetical protein